ncbi:MAG: hypothetical protein ABSG21_18285 [Spirochaetia bacterium]
MKERCAVVQQIFRRYQKADRRHKRRILDEFVQLTGYSRASAALVLRQWDTISFPPYVMTVSINGS